VIGVALIGAIGFAAYKFFKGDWKLPSLGGVLPSITDLPGVPADIKITLAESGVPGAAGDVVYNILHPDNLRQETTMPSGKFYQEAEKEIVTILPPGKAPTQEQITPRAVAMKVSSDIVDRGLVGSMALAPVTIGAGLGAITQQERYYKTLPAPAKQEAIKKTVLTRETWKKEHVPEYVAATALSSMFPPALVIGQLAEIRDKARAGMIKVPTPKPISPVAFAAGSVFPPLQLFNIVRSLL